MPDIDFAALQTLSWPDALLRIGLTCVFGFILGFDRSRKNKPVDFRVYMIVATTACLAALMGQEIHAAYTVQDDVLRLDLLRVIEGVLVGIGFLGAGAIIKRDKGHEVIGTATGASIWASGVIGLMLGFGLYGLAFLGFFVIAAILVVFGYLRRPLFHEKEKYDN